MRQSRSGKFIQATKSRYYLPFDHPFNLMLHIGVRSFQFVINTGYASVNEDHLKTWVLPVFEIDYVRVYGETVEGFRNDTVISNIPNDLPRIDSSIIYAFIGVVTILVILIIIEYLVLTDPMAENLDNKKNHE